MMLLAAALVLHVVAADETPIRLASNGTGQLEVAWTVDGALVATTRDGQAASVTLPPGVHDLWARSEATGPWRVLARPDAAPLGAAGLVEGWSASADVVSAGRSSLAGAFLLCALAAALWPRRSLLQASDAGPLA